MFPSTASRGWFEVPAGRTVQIRLRSSDVVVTLESHDPSDEQTQLSMYSTQAVNGTWQIGKGHVLVDTEARDVWAVERGDAGLLYSGGGGYGLARGWHVPVAPTDGDAAARDEGVMAFEETPNSGASSAGLAARPIDDGVPYPDRLLTLFLRTEHYPNGDWEVLPPHLSQSLVVAVRALQSQRVRLTERLLKPGQRRAGPGCEVRIGEATS